MASAIYGRFHNDLELFQKGLKYFRRSEGAGIFQKGKARRGTMGLVRMVPTMVGA
jgi:hypothetical protein